MNTITKDAKERMEKTLSLLKDQYTSLVFGGVGGALDNLKIEYYGSLTPLIQLAVIMSPYRGKYIVRPHDPTTLREIERAIQKANLGVNIATEKTSVLVTTPPATTEQRHKLADHADQLANEAKVAVRKIRQDGRTKLKKVELPEDDERKTDKELQNLTDSFCTEIDKLNSVKRESIIHN